MNIIKREMIKVDALPGRGIQRAVGVDSESLSKNMTVGYATYSEKHGVMEPHQHAEETVIIFDVKDGSVSWGDTKDSLTESCELERGMVLHIPENQWHAFHYAPGGFVEIVFIYGQSDNIRPEDNKK